MFSAITLLFITIISLALNKFRGRRILLERRAEVRFQEFYRLEKQIHAITDLASSYTNTLGQDGARWGK